MPSTEQILKVLKNERECIKRQIGECGFIDELPDGVIEATTFNDIENGERAFIDFGKGDTE